MNAWPITKAPEPPYCSFCGRSEHEATVLLAGPNSVFICDTCVDQARNVIAAKQRQRGFSDPASPPARGRGDRDG